MMMKMMMRMRMMMMMILMMMMIMMMVMRMTQAVILGLAGDSRHPQFKSLQVALGAPSVHHNII